MKFKTTARAIRNGYGTKYLFQTGYCKLQNLLRDLEPVAYTRGVYGWNFDLYEFKGVGITTGYRGMVGRIIPNKLIEKYEKKAQKIPYDKKEKRNKLRLQFIKELFQNASDE